MGSSADSPLRMLVKMLQPALADRRMSAVDDFLLALWHLWPPLAMGKHKKYDHLRSLMFRSPVLRVHRLPRYITSGHQIMAIKQSATGSRSAARCLVVTSAYLAPLLSLSLPLSDSSRI